MEKKPFIHLFKTSEDNYLYDVNTDTIIEIPERVYKYLNHEISEDIQINEYMEVLKKRGFLKDNHVQIAEHPETKYLKYYLERRLNCLLLQVTQNCNLRCDYCIYSGKYTNRVHSNRAMTFEMAKKGIDFLIEHSSDSEDIFLGFYGGEPLLEMELIKKCMDYILKRVPDKKVYFNMTTNGTLLTEEVVKDLIKYKISILISLDGPRNIHDEARKFAHSDKGSFDVLYKNLKLIKSKYPNYYKSSIHFNTVLHQENFRCVDCFVKCDDVLTEARFLVSLISDNYAKTKNNISEQSFTEIQYEKFLMFLSKLKILKTYTPSKLLAVDFGQIGEIRENAANRSALPVKGHRAGPCIPGVNKLFLTVNGSFFPCERVNETFEATQIGTIDKGLDVNKINTLMNLEKYTEKECHNCWAYAYCTICLSGIEDENGIQAKNILSKCTGVRKTVEERLKDYCVLSKLGCDFEESRETNEKYCNISI